MGETDKTSKAGARNAARDLKRIQSMHDLSVDLGAACPGISKTIPLSVAPSGNALKAVSRTDTELRVANYMVLFGGRDLEGLATRRINGDGSKGEYFTKATQFDSSYTDIGLLYVDWEHGAGHKGEPGPDDVLGYVDWKTAKTDEKGMFVERVLNRRNRYVQFLEELIDAGAIGNSSEAIPTGVQKADDGEILKWPIKKDTLTVAPMEPRMLTENTLTALKALGYTLPDDMIITGNTPIDDTSDPVATLEADSQADGESVTSDAMDGEDTASTADAKALLMELELLQL